MYVVYFILVFNALLIRLIKCFIGSLYNITSDVISYVFVSMGAHTTMNFSLIINIF